MFSCYPAMKHLMLASMFRWNRWMDCAHLRDIKIHHIGVLPIACTVAGNPKTPGPLRRPYPCGWTASTGLFIDREEYIRL